MDHFVKAVTDYRTRRETTPSELECEIRLGRMETSFCPGVSQDAFQQLEEDMNHEQLNCHNWTEHIDYHYLDSRGRQIRTRVIFDSKRMELRTEHVQKIVLHRFTIKIGRAHV